MPVYPTMFDLYISITKTCLYNFDPLKTHFYIVKLGFTGVYNIFLFCSKTQIVGTRLNRLVEAVLTSIHNLCFEQNYAKYQNFSSENFRFLVVRFSVYLNRRVFVMVTKLHQGNSTKGKKIGIIGLGLSVRPPERICTIFVVSSVHPSVRAFLPLVL